MANDLSTFIATLEKILGHPIRNLAPLKVAVTHRSYANEMATSEQLEDNERLEFLGDSVLDLIVSDWLMEKYPKSQEGDLSKYRSAMVNERSLAAAARSMDLGQYICLGRGEEMTLGREKDSILANAFEAVVAALYMSGSLEDARAFVKRFLQAALDSVEEGAEQQDFKTSLQELTQKRLKLTPNYILVIEEGPDHDKVFESEAWVGEKVYGRGRAKSKKDSEQLAAMEAIRALTQELDASN